LIFIEELLVKGRACGVGRGIKAATRNFRVRPQEGLRTAGVSLTLLDC
jgi:hypothetical protein